MGTPERKPEKFKVIADAIKLIAILQKENKKLKSRAGKCHCAERSLNYERTSEEALREISDSNIDDASEHENIKTEFGGALVRRGVLVPPKTSEETETESESESEPRPVKRSIKTKTYSRSRVSTGGHLQWALRPVAEGLSATEGVGHQRDLSLESASQILGNLKKTFPPSNCKPKG